jgi:hypothetical protein
MDRVSEVLGRGLDKVDDSREVLWDPKGGVMFDVERYMQVRTSSLHTSTLCVCACSRASETPTALAHLCSAYSGLLDPTATDSAPTTTWLATAFPTHHRGETSWNGPHARHAALGSLLLSMAMKRHCAPRQISRL